MKYQEPKSPWCRRGGRAFYLTREDCQRTGEGRRDGEDRKLRTYY